MLTPNQVAYYRENGYVAVEDVFTAVEMAEARELVDQFVEKSRAVTDSDDVFDLEPGHRPDNPRVRRLKSTINIDPVFERLARSPRLLDVVGALIGPEIRYHGSKLNMKAAEYGSPVEWHQDFSFYPHTNDDLLAVGIALDDCLVENGCMLMIPGSHRWPILDHHQDGCFAGAIDPEREGVDLSQAVPVPVHAGGVTLHHCRTLHGSAMNTSSRPRRLFLVEFAAVDACPIVGVTDVDQFNAKIWRGSPTSSYRVKEMDIRLALPKPARAGSIYEIQSILRPKVFGS